MGDVAKIKLVTSKGTVLAGGDLPDGLPDEERDAIIAAGGIDGEPSGKSSGRAKAGTRAKSGEKTAERKDAERAVKDAEAAVANATTDEARTNAQLILDEAKAALAAL